MQVLYECILHLIRTKFCYDYWLYLRITADWATAIGKRLFKRGLRKQRALVVVQNSPKKVTKQQQQLTFLGLQQLTWKTKSTKKDKQTKDNCCATFRITISPNFDFYRPQLWGVVFFTFYTCSTWKRLVSMFRPLSRKSLKLRWVIKCPCSSSYTANIDMSISSVSVNCIYVINSCYFAV